MCADPTMTLSSCARRTSERFQSTCFTSFQSVRKRACCLATSGWMPRPTTFGRLLESRSRVPLSGSRTSTSPSDLPPRTICGCPFRWTQSRRFGFWASTPCQVVICRRQPLLQGREVPDLKTAQYTREHPRSSRRRSLRILVNLLNHATHLSEPRFAEDSTNADIRHPSSTP